MRCLVRTVLPAVLTTAGWLSVFVYVDRIVAQSHFFSSLSSSESSEDEESEPRASSSLSMMAAKASDFSIKNTVKILKS